MTGEVVLRTAGPQDVAALAGVFLAAWRHGYPGVVPDDVLSSVDLPTAAELLTGVADSVTLTTMIAEIYGVAGGFIRYGVADDGAGAGNGAAGNGGRAVTGAPIGPTTGPSDAVPGYVAALYVHPDHAGAGVGRLLLDHAITALSAAGRRAVRLWVFAGNDRARRLYAAAGFVPDGGRITDPRWQVPQIRMRLSLPRPPADDLG